MAQCLEISLSGVRTFSVLGIVEDWEPIRAAAKSVERVEHLVGWEGFTAVYRVESETGPPRLYLVADR